MSLMFWAHISTLWVEKFWSHANLALPEDQLYIIILIDITDVRSTLSDLLHVFTYISQTLGVVPYILDLFETFCIKV